MTFSHAHLHNVKSQLVYLFNQTSDRQEIGITIQYVYSAIRYNNSSVIIDQGLKGTYPVAILLARKFSFKLEGMRLGHLICLSCHLSAV